MLSPKRQKFRKMQKGRMKGVSQRGHRLSNGMFGIKSLESKFITSRQIEAARIAATRYMKREGQLWIKIFPDKPITKKPLEVRMGKGKGAPEYFVAVVKPGRIMFEMNHALRMTDIDFASMMRLVVMIFPHKYVDKRERLRLIQEAKDTSDLYDYHVFHHLLYYQYKKWRHLHQRPTPYTLILYHEQNNLCSHS